MGKDPNLSTSRVYVYRLGGGDHALSDLTRRSEELATWLKQAENSVSALPVAATGRNLKELKVLQGSKQTHTKSTMGL